MNDWQEEMTDLCSAEEFLEFFGVEFDERVVRVNRLHILQRFHDYLARAPRARDADAEWARHATALGRAYADFVHSDAQTEKVFKIFRHGEPQVAYVPIASLVRKNP